MFRKSVIILVRYAVRRYDLYPYFISSFRTRALNMLLVVVSSFLENFSSNYLLGAGYCFIGFRLAHFFFIWTPSSY